ncbi:MAG: polyribonucleotide nucleotidyltransferase [Patescibacteria group bacterium]
MNTLQTFETQWGGKTLKIEVGKYANQAGGSCIVQYGETVILGTATMSADVREGLDFFPLTVEYEEKLYAAGRIKGSRFVKRGGRPTDEAVLTGRFIDRAVRPLFNEKMRNEVQIVITCLAFDGENDPDIIALLAASCALHISNIPWDGPIADIRIGQIEGEWVINPSYEARLKSKLDLAFAGTKDKILMVEAGAQEVDEQTVLDAFWFGMKHIDAPIKLIEDVKKAVGKEKKTEVLVEQTEEAKKVQEIALPFILEQIENLFFKVPKASKTDRADARREIKKRTEIFLLEKGINENEIHFGTDIIYETVEEVVSREILENDRRVDGRSIDQIRPLVSEVGVLPRVHGTGHFMRGETQVLSITTLGSPGDEQTLDGMEVEGKRRFFHHYNFPPFSVGETKPMRGPSRRDIGHGALAEKALLPVMPDQEDFPYTINVTSEVLTSNGSSSMGSTCAAALSLMDAGVPIKSAVAGIAMGVATNKKGDWKVFTDLQDLEDGKGGMDFKIAGTREGITAIQMDTKTTGLVKELVEDAFAKAKVARMEILDVMQKAIAEPRAELSPYAPRIISIKIDPERIGDVIGPGGKIINEIIDTTGVQSIDIEDSGLVMITSTNQESGAKALEWVKKLTREIKAGEIFEGKVVKIMEFGAFVELMPKKDGMVHVSELAPWHVDKVTDIVQVGKIVKVKVMEVDNMGRINLSMKQIKENYPDGDSNRPKNQSPPTQTDKKPRFGGFGRRNNDK